MDNNYIYSHTPSNGMLGSQEARIHQYLKVFYLVWFVLYLNANLRKNLIFLKSAVPRTSKVH